MGSLQLEFTQTNMVKFVALPFLGLALAHPEMKTMKNLIDEMSTVEKSWQSGYNSKFPADSKPSDHSYLMGSLEVPAHLDLDLANHYVADMDIPDTFDPRDQWGTMCPSLLEVRDQGSCGSYWAFGGAEAFTDRACIQSEGAVTVDLSTEDVLSCCRTCGMGCNGGYTSQTWSYFTNNGISTGGLYDGTGCKPYSIAPCVHHSDDTSRPDCSTLPMSDTPACTSTCVTGYTTNAYADDKTKLSTSYKVPRSVSSIQQELMTYGPAEASFTVYEDFLSYTGGVYYHVTGRSHGGHAVKIMGWGTDADTGMDYWLIANSWNSDWGEEGFFRIRRGTNECGIEAGIYAGNM